MNLPPTTTGSRLLTGPFALAVILLGGAAILAGPVAGWMRLQLVKESLPLKKPLAALNERALYPYRVVARHQLEPAIVDALGTKEYLNWTLEDESADQTDPLRVATLFVTYYSGGTDLVPHTPDACYLGFGYQPAQAHENTTVEIRPLIGEAQSIPVRLLTFIKTQVHRGRRISVIYTFHCNGEFVATREGVRVRVNHPLARYAYFSKVEVSFPAATREESVRGAARLLERVIPELLQHHWPDYAAAENALQPTGN